MFKNPYIMPIVGVIFLVVLFFFKKQQEGVTLALKAAHESAEVSKMAVENPAARPVECGSETDAELTAGKGSLEFDVLELDPAGTEDQLLFAVVDRSVDACRLDPASMAGGLALSLRPGEGRFTLALNGSAAALPPIKAGRLPLRIACQWDGKAAVLFVNGKKAGGVEAASGLPGGAKKVFLAGRPGRVKSGNLMLHLIPKS
jgi:hypothetical protein